MKKKLEKMRWRVTFDGCGLNDALSEYRPRLATLRRELWDSSFGKTAERAINLLDDLAERFPGLVNGDDDVNGADLVDFLYDVMREDDESTKEKGVSHEKETRNDSGLQERD